MYAEERQQAMAHLISRRGRLSVVQLADQFEVTTETVRRDLSTLDRMGLVRRVHGGAVPAGSLTVIESGIGERDQSNTQAKEAIANAAVALSYGDTRQTWGSSEQLLLNLLGIVLAGTLTLVLQKWLWSRQPRKVNAV